MRASRRTTKKNRREECLLKGHDKCLRQVIANKPDLFALLIVLGSNVHLQHVAIREPDSLKDNTLRLISPERSSSNRNATNTKAMEEAVPDLIRLERYQGRAWSRQQRAIREFLNIKFTRAMTMASVTVRVSGLT
jgi:hypothetical protein